LFNIVLELPERSDVTMFIICDHNKREKFDEINQTLKKIKEAVEVSFLNKLYMLP